MISCYFFLLNTLEAVIDDLSHLRKVLVEEAALFFKLVHRLYPAPKFFRAELGDSSRMTIREASGVLALEEVDNFAKIHI